MLKNVFIIVFLISHTVFGQRELTGVGQWQHHIPFNSGVRIAEVGDEIFAAGKLGMFSYHKESGEINIYSKVNGLSDVAISYIAYFEPLDILMIAYENTNIDILQGNQITNFNDILRKTIVGEKTIYHISFYDQKAYIATSFGVVVFDLVKMEVKETYNSLDSDGGSLKVFASTFADDSLYLATEKGILAARLSSEINLLDFNNWQNIRPQSGGYSFIGNFNNCLYALRSDTSLVETYVSSWTTDTTLNGTVYISIDDNNAAFISNNNIIIRKTSGNEVVLAIPMGNIPTQLEVDNNETYWFSDKTRGLTKLTNGVQQTMVPSGPLNSSIFNVSYVNGSIYSIQGGYDVGTKKLLRPFVVDRLGYESWFTLGYWSEPMLDTITDVVDVLADNSGNTYYATNSMGLVKTNSNGQYTLYNNVNSPLQSALDDGTPGFVRVPGIAIDSEGSVWVTNHTVPQGTPSIFKIKTDGNWESFNFPKIAQSRFPRQLYIDQNDVKWVILANGGTGDGVLVFDDEHPEGRHLKTGFENGDLQDSKINDIAFDKQGAVWLVGRSGVSVFQVPLTIFDGGELNDASKPIFEGRPLMENEYCTSIAIDEGNRKWIGTENGLFLMDEFGTSLLAAFNTSNSPLPTNKINDLELNLETGELFIATDLGLLSYRTNSSLAVSPCKGQIKVFPNPVEPNFSGEVGIFSLTNHAEIRITDSWGNLVHAVEANGGSGSWNLKDYNGMDVNAGIYFILVNGADRKASCTERLAIIR